MRLLDHRSFVVGILLCSFTAVCLPAWAWAQDDAIRAGVEYIAPAEIADLPLPGGNPEVSFLTVFADLAYPLQIKSSSTTFVLGLSYRGTVPLSEGARSAVVDSFHELGPRLTIVQELGSWSLVGQVGVDLATNFVDVDGDHVRGNGGGLVNYRFSDRFTLGAGVLATYAFGQLLPVPILRVDWQVSSHVALRAVLPGSLRLGWKPLDFIVVGVKGGLNGNRYVTRSDLVSAARQLAYSEANLTAYVDVNLFKPLWLSVYGGSTVFRRFELFDEAGEAIGDRSVDNAPLVGLSLSLRGRGDDDS